MPPPDAAPGGIGELDLELVRGRGTADVQFDRPRLRHSAGEGLPCDDETASGLEVIVEAERGAGGTGVAADDKLRLAGGHRAPAGDVAKVVKGLS